MDALESFKVVAAYAYANRTTEESQRIDGYVREVECGLQELIDRKAQDARNEARAGDGKQLAPGDVGRFELSAYHVGITRHEVAAAALDRIMDRDFSDYGERIANVEAHARSCALEAWAYANALFEVEHATEEQPS